MKLVYIANARIPTEKAHGIQIMKTCEALAAAGVVLELWLPKRKNPEFESADPFEFYNVKNRFSIKKFDCVDMIGALDFFPGLGFYIESKTFARSIAEQLREADYTDAVFYSRDSHPLVPIKRAGHAYFYEEHTLPKDLSSLRREILEGARGVVAISQGVAKELAKYIAEGKILIAPDGVELEKFSQKIGQKEARMSLGLPEAQKIVLYSGHLYDWKGADTLLAVALSAKDQMPDTKFVFVGGTISDVRRFQSRAGNANNIMILGHKAHHDIPRYLAAADVLILPNSGKAAISRQFTSPLKLFEYMAARRPIVASDLPSIREILDESTALFFTPDDPLDLAKKIKSVLSGDAPTDRLTVNAYKKVQSYTWSARAQKIKQFVLGRG